MFKKAFWGRGKTKKRTTALPLASKVCSTCALWGGSRKINLNGDIEIHPYSKGRCQGDGHNHLEMSALATCDKWEPWPTMNNYQGEQQAQGAGY
ncbi:MAG: hypothetical protein PHX53_00245 [Syntrophales bacterium]|nr:hypothetical protein [Syntrophales bacterium]